ncbi:MAG: metallophosphoesterase family protein [Akkermansiaceae bacterium]|jgi:serine/threonine protein phosphatase 1|nr:metallophosphoesterase family protein [Akkermansiaceae bacterium]
MGKNESILNTGRVLAIGDVHGCLKALKRLLKFVAPVKGDVIVMLGDYVDRGPKSKGVIDYLLNWKWEAELICLKGNHELIMDHSRRSKIHNDHWMEVGGEETLGSYGGSLSEVPASHWKFIRKALSFYETDDCIFVHGGLAPKAPPEEQDEEEMAWMRFCDAKPHQSGKLVICGHTVQRKGIPADRGHSICIDTAACRGGWLTCLDHQQGRFWQVQQKGKLKRMGKLPRKYRKLRKKVSLIKGR